MKIDRITTYERKAELDAGQQFYSSQGFFQDRTSLLVRVDTDDGMTGCMICHAERSRGI